MIKNNAHRNSSIWYWIVFFWNHLLISSWWYFVMWAFETLMGYLSSIDFWSLLSGFWFEDARKHARMHRCKHAHKKLLLGVGTCPPKNINPNMTGVFIMETLICFWKISHYPTLSCEALCIHLHNEVWSSPSWYQCPFVPSVLYFCYCKTLLYLVEKFLLV